MGFGRLPNGLGTISKLKQNLRKPYRARKLVGEEWDDKKLIVRRVYRTVGYYSTRKEALEALMMDGGGLSEGGDIVTLKAVYDAWSAKKYPTISHTLVGNYSVSFRVFEPLWWKKFSALRPSDYEALITDDVKDTRVNNCKILLHQLYDYALRKELVEKDYSKLLDFGNRDHKVRERNIFTPEEVNELWKRKGETWVDIVLVLLYTGFRAGELLSLDITKMKDGCFVGGMKTKNGRNRLVPIHPSILSMVEEYARKSAFWRSTSLFCDKEGNPVTMNQLKWHYSKVCPNHIIHETRHSFATYARLSGMDLLATKRILGHSIKDMTEDIYTHLDVDFLKTEMAKYHMKNVHIM